MLRADRVGLRRRRRVHRPAVPRARLRRRLGRAAALRPADAQPCADGAAQPGLRRRLRVRTAPPAGAACDPDGGIHARTVELPRDRVGGGDPRPPPRLHQLGAVRAQRATAGRQPHQRRRAPAREGRALLQGIVRCGGCGRSMSTHYSGGKPGYDCAHSRATRSPRRPAAA